MAAPTFVSSAQNFTNTTGARNVTGVSWNIGDLIIVKGNTEDNSITLTAPTNANLTFTAITGFPGNTNSHGKDYAWQATAGSSQTAQTIASAISGTGNSGGICVEVWRSHGGVSTIKVPTAAANGTTVSTTITTSAANSALSCGCSDWNASPIGATPYGTNPGAATNENKQLFAGHYGTYMWYHADAGAAGSKTISVTSSASITPMIWAIEILGTSSADATVTAVPMSALGSLVIPTVSAGSTVTSGAESGPGDLITPTVQADYTAAPVAGSGTGDLVSSVVTADAAATSLVVQGTGDLVAPSVEADYTALSPAALGTGDLVAPTITGSGGDAAVSAVPCAGTGDIITPSVSADSAITSPPVMGIGDLIATAITAGSTITSLPATGVGDTPVPSLSASVIITSVVADAIGDLLAPIVSSGPVTAPASRPPQSLVLDEAHLTMALDPSVRTVTISQHTTHLVVDEVVTELTVA